MRTVYSAPDAPKPAGAYSHAAAGVGRLIATAGFSGHDPVTAELAADVYTQTVRTLRSVRSALEAAGGSMASVLHARVYLTDLTDFSDMDRAFSEAFDSPYPARTTVYVTLPADMRVEIDVTAIERERTE